MKYTYTTHRELHHRWQVIKRRCNPSVWNEKPYYIGCSIHPDWKDNFQQFAEDYTSMIGYGLPNRQIDKDILVKGNKIYSKDTCVLVPHDINSLLTNNKQRRGNYPLGVSYDSSRLKYEARYCRHAKTTFIGRYDTPEEAFLAYKQAKENNIKYMAELYKHELDPRAYVALMQWEIFDTD